MIKSTAIRLAIVLAGIAVVVLGRGFFFYSGAYTPPPSEMPTYQEISVPGAPTSEFTDNYTEGKGIVLIDFAHDNAFDKDELNVLLLRLVSRGLTVKFFSATDDLKIALLGEEEANQQEKPPLDKTGEEEKEEIADAFMVVAPQKEFSKEEKGTIDKFLDKDGKLLLIADPTRPSKMNSLSINFGLIFEPDYLYNMKEKEINYRNIFISDFAEKDVTKGLGKIVLYTAGSISAAEGSIAFVDENTFSNMIETRKKLSPIALVQEDKVLAIYDLTFITEPYNGILDNNRLIANIADWLMPPAEKTETK